MNCLFLVTIINFQVIRVVMFVIHITWKQLLFTDLIFFLYIYFLFFQYFWNEPVYKDLFQLLLGYILQNEILIVLSLSTWNFEFLFNPDSMMKSKTKI